MIFFDAVITIGVLFACFLAASLFANHRAKTVAAKVRARRAQGELNAEETEAEKELVCFRCGKKVDPNVDVFVGADWWHRKCYLEENK